MTQHKPVKHIVIAGGGTAGWISAAVLSKALHKQVKISLIESDKIPTVGVGEATIPPIMTLHKILGLDEKEFLTKTNATFKLGISFENWKERGTNYTHSFGNAGQDSWACGFQHFWLAGLKQGIEYEYGDYCREHFAARQHKFSISASKGLNYAYHLDAGLYAKLLRDFSEKLGVTRIEGMIKKVATDSISGHITKLELDSGTTVEGDLFIDCTGFKALLIGDALHTGFIDWSHWLPCDSAVAVQTQGSNSAPYTRSIAHQAGWQWQIPLQNRTGNGLVYCSKYLDKDEAINTLLNNLPDKPINKPRVIPFRVGTRREHWRKNCIAIGLSSGFLEPLESTSIHLIQRSILRLVHLFPSQGINEIDIQEFNRQTIQDVERIRDFIILHYKLTNRRDSDFWNYCRTMDVPESLQQKIDLFRESGVVYKEQGELFGEESWVQVMLGQGLTPLKHHPYVNGLSPEELKLYLHRIRSSVTKTVNAMPNHRDFINFYAYPQKIKQSSMA